MSPINIKSLPIETGRSGWEAIANRSFVARELEQSINADWLIIGAGFAGLSAARRLKQLCPNDHVVLLDAQQIAIGAAGRNSGYMIDVPHNLSSGEYSSDDAKATALEIAQNRFAIDFAKNAAAEYGMNRETFDPSGKINAAVTPRGQEFNTRFAASLKSIGEAHEWLDAQAMYELTGSRYYQSGLRTPGAVLIQPADYIYTFAYGLHRQVDIYENSAVLGLEQQGNCWQARTAKGGVSAAKVILAVNGHLQAFGFNKGQLMHVFTYASMTAGFDPLDFDKGASGAERWALLPADPMGATVRKVSHQGKGRIVTRTRFTYDPSMQVSQARVNKIAAEQRQSFDARFPQLRAVPMEFSWAGRLCLTRNNVAVFGEIEQNLYSACVENGIGTVKSTLAGVLAADLATGTSSPYLNSYQNLPKPSLLPPEPIAWLGANATIRWQELRAGRES